MCGEYGLMSIDGTRGNQTSNMQSWMAISSLAIRQRRGDANRLGVAVQLRLLHFPAVTDHLRHRVFRRSRD